MKKKTPFKTALFDAAKRWEAAVKTILGASPALAHAIDPKGRTALHTACAVKPAAPGWESPMGSGPPRRCSKLARGENLPLTRFLLKQGADASYSLWAAVWRDDAVMCRELLKAKPRLNLQAPGETPIFYAARLQRMKTLDLLIAAGANPAIRDASGRDAVDITRARRLPKDVIDRLAALKR